MAQTEHLYVLLEEDLPVAVYRDKELATKHSTEMNLWTCEVPLLTELPPELTDEAAVQVRRLQREESHNRYIESLRVRDAMREVSEKWQREQVQNTGKLAGGLCSCETFDDKPLGSKYGYCNYCGNWSPSVFLAHNGADALRAEIDKLEEHRRIKMCTITATLLNTSVR